MKTYKQYLNENIEDINNLSEEEQLEKIKKDPFLIKYINNPSEDIQLFVVSRYGFLINHIINPSKKAQLIAVSQDGHNISNINNPSEDVKLAAVKNCGYAIQWINNPSEEIKLAAIKQTRGKVIEYIDNLSKEIQEYIIINYPDSVLNNPNVSKKISPELKQQYSHLLSGEDLGI